MCRRTGKRDHECIEMGVALASGERKVPVRTENLSPVVLVGMESVGKSTLLSALTGSYAESSAMLGTTLHCKNYSDGSRYWVDTPGLVTKSDASTVKDTIAAISSTDTLLVVLRSYRALQELQSLWTIIKKRKIAIVLTFSDRLAKGRATSLSQWRQRLGVPILLLDSRSLSNHTIATVRAAVKKSQPLKTGSLPPLPSFDTLKKSSWKAKIESLLGFAPISLLLLFAPAWIAVTHANLLADHFYDTISKTVEKPLNWVNTFPEPFSNMLGGDYGVVAMFPFLLLYALPTIFIFTLLISIYKTTGLIDRLSQGLHRWLKPFGLSGRDLVRVVMGFGCNVPAVLATRSCCSHSRCTCVAAISFGSACSYQLPATLAVFVATGFAWLGFVYLSLLAITTLIYLRLTTPPLQRLNASKSPLLVLGNLRTPDWRVIKREAQQSFQDFATVALPIFMVIGLVAGLLHWSGALGVMTRLLAPVMACFNLPPEAALAVVLGAVRKDGLAIGLLNSDWDTLKVPIDTPIQILTAVYLAGVLLPCLVTVITISKEMRPRFALKMLGRQAYYATIFSLFIAWIGAALMGLIY